MRDAVKIGIFVATLAPLLVLRLLRRRGSGARVPLLVLLPPLASLVYVFGTAPFARYAGATLALLAAEGIGLLLLELSPFRPRAAALVAAVAAVVVAAVPLAQANAAFRIERQFAPVSPPRYAPVRLETGFEVMFSEQQMCWDAPLPCTPVLNQRLRLRRAGDLSSGFVLDSRS
jgi:hypothetical protein